MTAFIQPQFDSIPIELQKLPRWVSWNAEGHPGEKLRKVPYSPDRPNTRASSTDPTTWGSFRQAEAAYFDGDRTGVGIVLNGDGLVGVDIDHCVTDGAIDPAATELLGRLGAAYIELSPSGTGLRAFGYSENLATGAKGKCDGLDVELYSTGRYLTLTGVTIKAGPLAPLVGFGTLANTIRATRKVNPETGKTEQAAPDQYHAALVQRVLSGDVYHDSLRDLSASMVATGMRPGAVVNHLRGLMDASTAPHDDRWQARRGQIPDLVSSASRKFSPLPDLDFSGVFDMQQGVAEQVDPTTGESTHWQESGEQWEPPKPPPLLKPVSVHDVLTNPAPPPAFVWDGYLPRGVVALLGAHGGTGKSTISLMLGVCAALGRPLFGVDTVPCKVLFVSLEDGENIVRHRLAGICRVWGINPHDLYDRLQIVDGTEHPELFSAETRGNGNTTRTYSELRQLVQLESVGLVVVDNASDAYGGDEIQRRQVRAFMRALVEVARLTDCAVMLLAHVDKTTSRNKKADGGEGYSGSTAWHNSARSRLFLTRGDDGLLKLEHQKSNLGKMREPIALEWLDAGLPQLVNDDSLTGFTERLNGRADEDRAAALLKLIAEFEGREQYCSPAPQARNNVHSMLRSEPAFLKLKLRPDDTKRIVNQCQRAKWMEPLAYKSAHTRKYCQRWTITNEGRLFAALPAPTSPTAPTCHVGTDTHEGAICGAPTAPTYTGGVGDSARTEDGAQDGASEVQHV